MKIDNKHPRALSLAVREKLVRGVKKNLASQAGLIAHGRGEAFDYLIGERTENFALESIKAAAAILILSKKPVLSINGNVASIALKKYIDLARMLGCKIEVNLFHFKKSRVEAIENEIRKIDPCVLLSSKYQKKVIFPDIASSRKIAIKQGIGNADTVFVPLEDGDRCQALIKLGKKVVTCDLNPLSRTAQSATVTIVDNIIRSLPILTEEIKEMKTYEREKLEKIVRKYDNKTVLRKALSHICVSMKLLSLSK